MISANGQLGVGPRFIRARPELILNQRPNRVGKHVQPIDIRPRRANRLIGGQHGQKRIGRRGLDIEIREISLGFGECGLRASDVHAGFALTKSDRFPRKLHAGRTAPHAVVRARAQHRAGDLRHNRLRQQQAEHVVLRCAILLPQHVEAREIRRSGNADPFLGSLRACATLLDRRIVLERELNGVVQRERAGRGRLAHRTSRIHEARQYCHSNEPGRNVTP